MASRIKGITVKIDGDATGLDKALTGVNNKIRGTQSQLRDVERLLKLNPASTELLQQKQRLLAQAVGETKGKLDTLKTAEAQAQEQFKQGKISQEQYDALRRELIDTEQTLKSLEDQAKKSNVALSKISGVADGISKASGKVAATMTPVTVGIVGLGTAAATAAAGFETSLAKVSTIADTSKKSLEEISDEVLRVSSETGVGASEVNEALYQAISAGADTAAAMDLVETSLKLAKGGFTDASTAVDGLTTVLNTYGLETSEAERISNQFLVTQNKGKTTAGELAASIGKVAPVAKSAGVSSEELMSSLAALTANGIATSEAATGMKAALSNIIKPSATAAEAAKALGIEFSASALQSKGLSGFMEELQKKTHGNLDTMSKLFGSTEALNTVLSLTSNEGMTLFSDTMTEMRTNTGATQDAFEAMSGTTQEQMKQVMTQIQNLGITLGEMLLPIISEVLKKVGEFVEWFASLDPGIQAFILGALAMIAAIAPIAGIISVVSGAIGTIAGALAGFSGAATLATTATTALSTAMAFLAANPIVAVIAIIVALVLVIAKWGDQIKAVLKKVDDFLQKIFVKDWTEVFGPVLGNILNGFFATVKSVWDSIMVVFNGVIDFVQSVFAGDWEGAWKAVMDIFSGLFGQLEAIAKAPINGIIAMLNAAIDCLNSLIKGLNKIEFDIPDWVPGLGGKTFGINIPLIGKLEYLAKGGVLSSGSAIVGERGMELLTMMGGKAHVTPLPGGGPTSKASVVAGAAQGGGDTYYITVDARNIEELNDMVRIAQNAKQSRRMGYVGR